MGRALERRILLEFRKGTEPKEDGDGNTALDSIGVGHHNELISVLNFFKLSIY
jgi:hypothetical protein